MSSGAMIQKSLKFKTPAQPAEPIPVQPAKTFHEALAAGPSAENAGIVWPKVRGYVREVVSLDGKLKHAQHLISVRDRRIRELEAELARLRAVRTPHLGVLKVRVA